MLISIPLVLLAEILPHGATFPDDEALCRFVAEHYRLGDYLPVVRVEGDTVLIEFDAQVTDAESDKFRRIVQLAEGRKYAEAKRLIGDLINEGTAESEIFRVYGQILFDEREYDEVLNQFIEALKWNPDNVSALIMVGNLYAKQKKDIKTARRFFEQALGIQPNRVTALTNHGSVQSVKEHARDARRYFEREWELQPNYVQTHLGIPIILEAEADLLSAFDHINVALKKVQERILSRPYHTSETRRPIEIDGHRIKH